jgi:hypothetical protein
MIEYPPRFLRFLLPVRLVWLLLLLLLFLLLRKWCHLSGCLWSKISRRLVSHPDRPTQSKFETNRPAVLSAGPRRRTATPPSQSRAYNSVTLSAVVGPPMPR